MVANATGALQIWPEHRYYADSPPYLPDDDFAHFTIEQALVDHIELVLYVQALTNLTRSPVIAIGSSYSKHTVLHSVTYNSVELLSCALAASAWMSVKVKAG